jgi:glyoxylase-like metal-dependent hydrolase (beta-lactamase superfamily II)
MSLDTTSQIIKPRLDELVPSRYALRVGDIDVMVISDGVLPITTVTMATNAASADLSAWLKVMYLPQEMIDWPLNVAVVRSGGKTILIDSGLGTEFPDFPRAGQLAMRLDAAGIDPASVTDVVLTHLHMDHIGGLIVRTGGHTPGHSIVRLESGGERLTFAGDAVFQPGFDNPEWYNGFEHDPKESARVRVRLLTELAASGEQLVATHLPFPSVCHVAVAGEGFRMVPAVWDY